MLLKPDSCIGCPLHSGPYGKPTGYVPAEGSGDNGTLIILEAAGEDEEACGRPTVGRAGQYLWSTLSRVGIDRGGFRIHNVLSCRPPGNKLIGQPYTQAAIDHCAPNLNETVEDHKGHCAKIGKTPVVVALGKFAFRSMMAIDDKHPIMHADYQTYPHWSDKYGIWVMSAPHPSFIMQGNHHVAPTLQYVIQRALEIASDGLILDSPYYLLDPSPEEFFKWVQGYIARRHDPDIYLSYDIETPYKSGHDEDDIAREDDDDYTILRVSFCYEPGNAVSVPWTAEYIPGIEQLFQSGGVALGWNNNTYDDRRIMEYMPMNVVRLDAMLAWHVLNTSMPKGLGFVTPFYWKNTSMWKHLSDSLPAFYNAKDADAALRCFLGIKKDLVKNKLWDVFERHVVLLNEVLAYMSRQGVKLDMDERMAAEVKLQGILDSLEASMQGAVPIEARSLKVYKKEPKDVTGMVKVAGKTKATQCPNCLLQGVKADHYKSIGKKRLAAGELENPCAGVKSSKIEVEASLWAIPLEFKLSKKGLMEYQKVRGHKQVINRKEGKVTYDVNAVKTLIRNYPSDPLYPIIGQYRGTQKLLSTYVGVTNPETGRIRGGMPVGRDGRVHCLYTHNPSTLRLASMQPNMQNLPRPSKDPDALSNIIRNLIVAEPGKIFLARDFSGIEAVLVGYEAKDKDYIRLARRDVHSFYTAYALNQLDGRVSGNDLPLLGWDDDKLFARLNDIKGEFKADRNNLYKHLVHAINFGQGPKGAQEKIYKETDIVYDVKLISRLMDIYRELFPLIPKWQRDVRLQADRDGFLRNAFGYVHRFNHVFAWKRTEGDWERVPGDDSEAVLAFRPQSNAAGIMKEALLRLYMNRFEEAGQYLRMTIHDEIFCECDPDYVPTLDAILTEEMERPVPQLPLPESYGMGPYLVVLTESKVGSPWGRMK
jgi:uracil-DNA glycosylase family 4